MLRHLLLSGVRSAHPQSEHLPVLQRGLLSERSASSAEPAFIEVDTGGAVEGGDQGGSDREGGKAEGAREESYLGLTREN